MAQIIGAVWPLLLTAQGLPTGATRPPRTNPQVTLADSKRVRFRQLMPRPWGWWSFPQCHAWSPTSPVPAGPGDLRAKEGWERFAPLSTRTARKVLGVPQPPKTVRRTGALVIVTVDRSSREASPERPRARSCSALRGRRTTFCKQLSPGAQPQGLSRSLFLKGGSLRLQQQHHLFKIKTSLETQIPELSNGPKHLNFVIMILTINAIFEKRSNGKKDQS